MEVGCLRHPGTSPIGSQLLQTVPMDGKSWQPSHEPPRTKKTGTRHTDKTVKRESKGLGGGGVEIVYLHTQQHSLFVLKMPFSPRAC